MFHSNATHSSDATNAERLFDSRIDRVREHGKDGMFDSHTDVVLPLPTI